MSIYRMSEDELIELASEGLKSKLTPEQLFSDQIELNHLKRVDKVFNKGLTYYTNPSKPIEAREASIFFRKTDFDTDLNFGARQIVNHFEALKISLSGIAKLSDLKIERKLPIYSITDNPSIVAQDIRGLLYPEFKKEKRRFLEALIGKFSEYNILVFEFVETWNKTHKANIDGVFIQPNVIVLKRQQRAFNREIFTLIHELGHYLLNKEEVEEVKYNSAFANLSATEQWCNSFAFAFLIGDNYRRLNNLRFTSKPGDYHYDQINNLSSKTHLSRLSIYTHLFINKQIKWEDYIIIKEGLDTEWQERLEQEALEKERDKQLNIKREGRSPKPIQSPLFISTLQTAFYEGVINEYEFCKTLNISPDKFNTYIE